MQFIEHIGTQDGHRIPDASMARTLYFTGSERQKVVIRTHRTRFSFGVQTSASISVGLPSRIS